MSFTEVVLKQNNSLACGVCRVDHSFHWDNLVNYPTIKIFKVCRLNRTQKIKLKLTFKPKISIKLNK